MKSPQKIYEELCNFVSEQFNAIDFLNKGRGKLIRSCEFAEIRLNIKKSSTSTEQKVRFTIDVDVYVKAFDWIKRDLDSYWKKNMPDRQIRLHKFASKGVLVNDWWEIQDEIDASGFKRQISNELIENLLAYVKVYESHQSLLDLWLSYVNSSDAKLLTKIEYAALLFEFNKKTEGQRYMEEVLSSVMQKQDRRMVVEYIEKFSKKFY